MERSQTFEKVRSAILKTSPDLDPAEVTESSSFQTLGLDSLKLVELGVWVEQMFGEKIVLDDWVDEESLKGRDGFSMTSFLDFIDRSLAA
ncbi:MAG: phosphopantetheine-binding protein [Thermoanaerobaculia bacterium]